MTTDANFSATTRLPFPADIETRIAEFEVAWRLGKVPRLTDFLLPEPSLSTDQQRSLALQLVAVDMEYRWLPDGTKIAADDPLGAKPFLALYLTQIELLGSIADPPAWLVAEEYGVRQLWGDHPSHDQFLAEHPAHVAELLTELIRIDRELAADEVSAITARQPFRKSEGDPRAPLPYTDYLIQQHLGTGGMGKVYRATQRSLGRPVAIKALRKSRQDDPSAVEQFLQEARIVGQLRHPNIVGVHGLGRFPGGGFFLVMDLISGVDLATRLQAGPFPIAEAVRITAEVAGAIQCAHEHGVVHCDLKPANVLMDHSGHVFVTDFGLAALLSHRSGLVGTRIPTMDGAEAEPPARRSPGVISSTPGLVIGGTRGYLAPELLASPHTEPSVTIDVYGLGAILYSLLTGCAPGEQAKCLRLPDNIPQSIAEVCLKCLCREPAERFSTAAAVRIALADS
ncbi:MAG: serine/threonine protein kinase [Planctomycetes bacterium]|nr:serine/threonine protein kinase [Planctomycetota bacterium]